MLSRSLVLAVLVCSLSKGAAFSEDVAGRGKDASARPEAQIVGGYAYRRPRWYTAFKRFPADLKEYGKTTFRKKNIFPIALVAAGTGVLIALDQRILDGAQDLGSRLRISHTHQQKTLVSVDLPGYPSKLEIAGPHDIGSALYFIGDGWVDAFIAGGFLTYGLTKSDNRALQTSSQIVESVFASGVVVQVLKHITGRESPFTTNVPGGRWRFFPNQVDYAKNTSKYDAYPAGHIASSMATVTVLSENYSEQKWIRPVGYTLITVLGFQMLNNGVHWASDYPLGIALGYGFGRIAVAHGRTRQGDSTSEPLRFFPIVARRGLGLGVWKRF